MIVSIIGANGMLSMALTKFYYGMPGYIVNVYGLDAPVGYFCDGFTKVDLVQESIDYASIADSDVVFYASGAGVQAALITPPDLMYNLNVSIPIRITQGLIRSGFKGVFVSFGSYMEIGLNDVEEKAFTEEEVICSHLPVTNDYALSKRLFGRYMFDFRPPYCAYHFVLPNLFSQDDLKPGTRLVPYVLQYLQRVCAGDNPEAPSFSAGLQARQFVTLEEMIEVINVAINKRIPTGVYNVGGGDYIRIRELIERLFALYGVPCKDEYFGKEVRRDGDIRSLRISGEKLRVLIGRLPEKTIEEIFSRDNTYAQ